MICGLFLVLILSLFSGLDGICFIRTAGTGEMIYSPGFPNSNYINNLDYCWRITADPIYAQVEISFRDFRTQYLLDKVTLYNAYYTYATDTPSGGSTEIGSISGKMTNGVTFTSTGRYMTVRFQTDSSTTDQGFQFCICASTIVYSPCNCSYLTVPTDDTSDSSSRGLSTAATAGIIAGVLIISVPFIVGGIIGCILCGKAMRLTQMQRRRRGGATVFQNVNPGHPDYKHNQIHPIPNQPGPSVQPASQQPPAYNEYNQPPASGQPAALTTPSMLPQYTALNGGAMPASVGPPVTGPSAPMAISHQAAGNVSYPPPPAAYTPPQ